MGPASARIKLQYKVQCTIFISITFNWRSLAVLAVRLYAECIQSYKPNPILAQPAPNINHSEQSLPRVTRRVLTQLRAGKSPILCSYLHMIDSKSHPSPLCPLRKSHEHTTSHLFSCQKINTTLNVRDLWDYPVGVAALLQQWMDAQGATEEGLGSSLT